jgi:hypothetical protein
MTLSAITMEQESMLYDINSQQSFEVLPLKLYGQRKTRVRTIESHTIQQSLDMNRLVAFVNMTLQPDLWGQTTGRSSSWHKLEP